MSILHRLSVSVSVLSCNVCCSYTTTGEREREGGWWRKVVGHGMVCLGGWTRAQDGKSGILGEKNGESHAFMISCVNQSGVLQRVTTLVTPEKQRPPIYQREGLNVYATHFATHHYCTLHLLSNLWALKAFPVDRNGCLSKSLFPFLSTSPRTRTFSLYFHNRIPLLPQN